jgi:glutamine amidotransferase
MGLVIVETAVGNLTSVHAAFQRLGADATITADPATIAAADRLVLPGVGAAGAGMADLTAKGLAPVLRAFTKPLLGVCLGFQLLFTRSEEGAVATLGLLPGVVRALASELVTLPHMGWNQLELLAPQDPFLRGIMDGDHCYFVHSYAVEPGPGTIAISRHGAPFAAVVHHGHLFGCQFHPERSSAVGARFIANFLAA